MGKVLSLPSRYLTVQGKGNDGNRARQGGFSEWVVSRESRAAVGISHSGCSTSHGWWFKGILHGKPVAVPRRAGRCTPEEPEM
ncbi:50S ribosomal protein L3 [Sesbania bispinosa]|nr:50S ribosomal protein L3 [Sesbania bispinosa]